MKSILSSSLALAMLSVGSSRFPFNLIWEVLSLESYKVFSAVAVAFGVRTWKVEQW